MRYLEQLPIWRDANQLMAKIEIAVRHFPRYHKYTLGTDLRRQAMMVCRLIVRAHHKKVDQITQIDNLVLAIDDLKTLIYLGKEVKAFQRFDEFETIARQAVAIGRQSGGWRKAVAKTTSKTKNNALWCMFSGVDENVYWGTDNYQFKSKVSTILNDLFKYYQLEGMNMSYTRVDYEREMMQRFLASFTPNEVLSHYKPEERLYGLPLEQRLAGLTADQIRVYLEKLEQSKY